MKENYFMIKDCFISLQLFYQYSLLNKEVLVRFISFIRKKFNVKDFFVSRCEGFTFGRI